MRTTTEARKGDRTVKRAITRGARLLASLVLVSACQEVVLPEPPPSADSLQRISFRVQRPSPPRRLDIPGVLRLPANTEGKAPAIVLLHGARGIDGTGAHYAQALNEAGIATLEIDLIAPRGLPTTAPLTPADIMVDAYGALDYLAAHPVIDATRIGIAGLGWGGSFAVIAAAEHYVKQSFSGEARFAAHLALYPMCHLLHGDGPFSDVVADSWTQAPILILAAGLSDYESFDSCPKFLASLPEDKRALVSEHVYQNATFGFDDARGPRTFFDRLARFGRGGRVSQVPDAEAAADARERVVAFFGQAFGLSDAPASGLEDKNEGAPGSGRELPPVDAKEKNDASPGMELEIPVMGSGDEEKKGGLELPAVVPEDKEKGAPGAGTAAPAPAGEGEVRDSPGLVIELPAIGGEDEETEEPPAVVLPAMLPAQVPGTGD